MAELIRLLSLAGHLFPLPIFLYTELSQYNKIYLPSPLLQARPNLVHYLPRLRPTLLHIHRRLLHIPLKILHLPHLPRIHFLLQIAQSRNPIQLNKNFMNLSWLKIAPSSHFIEANRIIFYGLHDIWPIVIHGSFSIEHIHFTNCEYVEER